MKILFVLENYLPHIGGAELLFKNLSEGLAKKGHEIAIITHHIPGTKKKEVINGVRIIRVPCFDNRYLFTFMAVPYVIKYAKYYDVVSTTTPNGAGAAWAGARFRGKPVLITVLETWIGKWKSYTNFSTFKVWVHEILERAIFFLNYDRYACISHSTEKCLVSAKPKVRKRTTTLYIGFDPSHWKKKRNTAKIRKKLGLKKSFVVLGYGRPGTSKGFPYLVNSFPEIKKRIPEAKLVLILSKDKQYAKEVEKFKEFAHNDVIFLDPQSYDDLPGFIQMANCVVVPSISEGFGYTTLETCATGTPVVASNTTSIPEVVHGKHILVPPRNSHAIAVAVEKVKKKQYKNTKAKSFPWSATIRKYEKEYKRLVK